MATKSQRMDAPRVPGLLGHSITGLSDADESATTIRSVDEFAGASAGLRLDGGLSFLAG